MTTECVRCAVLEGLVDRYAWERGDAQRRMIEAQEKRTEAQREISRLRQILDRIAYPQHDATPTSGCTEECGRCNDLSLIALRALAPK